MTDWTVHDDEDDFSRVQEAAVAAAREGRDLSALLIALREANPPGATVDVIADAAKLASDYLHYGDVVYPSVVAASKHEREGIVTARTEDGGVRVFIGDPTGDGVRYEDWRFFALPCEGQYAGGPPTGIAPAPVRM